MENIVIDLSNFKEKEQTPIKTISYDDITKCYNEVPLTNLVKYKCDIPNMTPLSISVIKKKVLTENDEIKEQFQFLLNKLVTKNIHSIEQEMKNINIKNQEQISIIAKALFDKVCEEPSRGHLYFTIIKSSSKQKDILKDFITQCAKELNDVLSYDEDTLIGNGYDIEEAMPYVNKMINMTKIISLIYMLDIITFELIQDCYDKIYIKLVESLENNNFLDGDDIVCKQTYSSLLYGGMLCGLLKQGIQSCNPIVMDDYIIQIKTNLLKNENSNNMFIKLNKIKDTLTHEKVKYDVNEIMNIFKNK